MLGRLSVLAAVALSYGAPVYASTVQPDGSLWLIAFEDDITAEAGGMHNVRIQYNTAFDGPLSLHYGACDVDASSQCHHTLGKTYVGNHHLAKRHAEHPLQRPSKFVWLPPLDASTGGCLHAYSETALVGRSSPVTITSRMTRKSKRWVAAVGALQSSSSRY